MTFNMQDRMVVLLVQICRARCSLVKWLPSYIELFWTTRTISLCTELAWYTNRLVPKRLISLAGSILLVKGLVNSGHLPPLGQNWCRDWDGGVLAMVTRCNKQQVRLITLCQQHSCTSSLPWSPIVSLAMGWWKEGQGDINHRVWFAYAWRLR